jgi:hypothetical protein
LPNRYRCPHRGTVPSNVGADGKRGKTPHPPPSTQGARVTQPNSILRHGFRGNSSQPSRRSTRCWLPWFGTVTPLRRTDGSNPPGSR